MSYKTALFNYLGITMRAYVSNGKASKHSITITGKKGKIGFIVFTITLIFVIAIFMGTYLNMYFDNKEMEYINFGFINISTFIFQLLLMLLAVIIVLIKRKILYKKLEPKSTNINIYSRDLPSKLRPAHMRLLLNDGLIDGVSFGATIVDLIDKGYLEYVKESNINKIDIFRNDNIKLIRTSKPDDRLLKYEKYLIDWFMNKYGNGHEVSAGDINRGLININLDSRNEPADMFMDWQALVLLSFPMDKYYNRVNFSYAKSMIYLIAAIIGGFVPYVGFFICVYCFGSLFLTNPKRVLNKIGVNEIGEWLSLKKFLIDFGDMNNKTAQMVEIWDYYLTYSIALEVSNTASNEINKFFGNNIYLGELSEMTNIEGSDVSETFDTIKNYKAKEKEYIDKIKLEIEEEQIKYNSN